MLDRRGGPNHGHDDTRTLLDADLAPRAHPTDGPQPPAPLANLAVRAEVVAGADVLIAGLVNLSCRALVGVDEKVLIPGLALGGPNPKRLLMRAVGPSIASFGVTGLLADPVLELLDASGAVVQSNDDRDRDQAPTVEASTSAAGSFALAPGSRDAALVRTLDPGVYTIRVSGKARTSGVALVEVHEVP